MKKLFLGISVIGVLFLVAFSVKQFTPEKDPLQGRTECSIKTLESWNTKSVKLMYFPNDIKNEHDEFLSVIKDKTKTCTDISVSYSNLINKAKQLHDEYYKDMTNGKIPLKDMETMAALMEMKNPKKKKITITIE